MPKRKSDNDCDRIERKIRKLEKKLSRKRHRRHHGYSSGSDSLSPRSLRSWPEKQADEIRSHVTLIDDNEILNDPSHLPEIEEQTLEPGPYDQDSQIEREVTVPSVVVIPQNSAGPSTSAIEPIMLAEQVDTESSILDNDLLEILGIDPTTDKKYGKELQKDLSVRLQHWATAGLGKDLRKELKERYLTPDNCKLIDPPMLNAEMKAAISEMNVKRDKAIESKQKTLTLAIACLGEAITLLMSSKDKDNTLLKLLMDAARIACDCQHADSITRRNFVTGGLKSEMKEQLQNIKVDKFLFGENLAEVLKSAKAICKTGSDLKPPAPKPLIRKQMPSTASFVPRHLNWQNPGPVRRPTGPPRMRQPAPTSMHSRPFNSLRQSQHPQQRPGNMRR